MAVAVHHDEEMAYVPLHIGYVRRSAVPSGRRVRGVPGVSTGRDAPERAARRSSGSGARSERSRGVRLVEAPAGNHITRQDRCRVAEARALAV